MKKSMLFKIYEYLILGFLVFAYICHLKNISHSDDILIVAALGYFVFMIFAFYQILTSPRIKVFEKVLWVMGLIFFFLFAALYYLISGYNRVVEYKN